MPNKKTKKVKKTVRTKPVNKKATIREVAKARLMNLRARAGGLLARRPHRSFHRTRRRDYVRPLQLPGYWAFTNQVRKLLAQNKKLFLGLVTFYGVLTGLLVGLASQENYSDLGDFIRDTGSEVFNGKFSELGNAGLILSSIATGAFGTGITEAQGIYAAFLGLLVWLATVWLLRAVMAGKRPRLRDGLYNSGAPIVPTILVMLVLMVQLLPVALVIMGYGAAVATGLLSGGVEEMVFWAVSGLLMLLSFYWIASTMLALVVITLPGMYPLQAIRAAGDLIIGRRIRMLLRLLWLLLTVVVTWIVIMMPLILLDAWVKGMLPAIEWLPVVPVALLVMGSLTVIWSASYVYLLYRKVVDDDTAPS